MSNYNIGDLVWIPDGTITYKNQHFIGVPLSGPQCGLVLQVQTAREILSIKVGNENHAVPARRARKIESEEVAYD